MKMQIARIKCKKQSSKKPDLTLCLPSTNPPCATLFWGTLELGRHLEVLCSIRCIFLHVFTCKLFGKFQIGKLIMHADSANQKQW